MTISAWNGSVRFTPATIVAPADVPELVSIVKDRACYPSPLRALGELHTLNEAIATDGTAVFMKHFRALGNPVWTTDRPARCTVTVGAGVRMIDLKNHLKRYGLQLEVVPEIGNATAGSVACCGTKDSSLGRNGLGAISSTVVGVRMVDANGNDTPITEATNPGLLRIVRSSYGVLGIIHEVTFAVQKRVKVKYRYRWRNLDRWLGSNKPLPPPDCQEILGNADGFLAFLLPYRRQLLIERRTVARVQIRLPGLDQLKLGFRSFAWATGARPFASPLRFLPRRTRHWVICCLIKALDHALLRFMFMAAIGRFVSYRADAMIDFKRPVSSYFDFTFWAFPVSQWGKIVPAYLEFCEAYLSRTGFRPALPTEVYYIRKDDHALLSFSPDEDIFTLDAVNWSDEEPGCWRSFNQAYNEFALRHGGRPVLNQTKELPATLRSNPAVAPLLWRQPWHDLAATRRSMDPDGRFLTPYFRDVLPS